MVPSEAERSGYERTFKYPKSTKYGRQNSISERWNSDEQLVLWREVWADTVNQLLETKGIDGRIDHRSFKAQGLTDQPTIHEGISARIMEKKGFPSDKCELNRMIKADNQLLHKLKAEFLEIANAVKKSIPKIAKTMETIFTNLIVFRYNQSHAQRVIDEYKEWLKEVNPANKKYLALKKQIKAKKSLLKDMKEERKTTSALNVPKMFHLTKEITTLTEEIEELKNALHDVYFYYHTEDKFKEYCAEIPAWRNAGKNMKLCMNA